jgi:phosphoribosylformimino-5-aminoimidazole carboxamide ribotide isomerase
MENREWRMENWWTVYPAIDLRRGRVVRLRQGDPDRETRYASDPLSVARRWQEAGAAWLHVVNLDGAFDEGGRESQAALERILTTGLKVQFGGGVRDLTTLCRTLDLGVSRVVIGTAAVSNPELVDDALRAFGPDRIALGIDARDDQVRTHGWTEAAPMTAVELARHWAVRGVRWVIFTDVSRDGMGSGLNLKTTIQLAQVAAPSATDVASASGQAPSASQRGEPVEPSGQVPSAGARRRLHVIASGGVASLADVRQAYQAGLSGVIIGRALYEGQVALEEALRVGTAMAWMETWNVGGGDLERSTDTITHGG